MDGAVVIVFVCLLMVILLAGIGVGIYFIVKSKKNQKCNPGSTKDYDFKRREWSGTSWGCPPGWENTTCDWNDGKDLGERQCRILKTMNTMSATPPASALSGPAVTKPMLTQDQQLSAPVTSGPQTIIPTTTTTNQKSSKKKGSKKKGDKKTKSKGGKKKGSKKTKGSSNRSGDAPTTTTTTTTDTGGGGGGGGGDGDKFPPGSLDKIIEASGMTMDQIDKVMQLIMNFEQSDTRWWLYYGYCRALSYDWNQKWRGITLTLYGATTSKGDSKSDAVRLFQAYGKSLQDLGYKDDKECCQIPGCKSEKLWTISRSGRSNPEMSEAADIRELSAGCEFCKNVSGLNDDPAWRTAVWEAFTTEYWLPAIEAVKKNGLPQKPAVYGFFVDWALNEGKEGMQKNSAKAKDIAAAVSARAKSGACCNGSAKNAQNRAKMWGEAMTTNVDLTQSVEETAKKFKPS